MAELSDAGLQCSGPRPRLECLPIELLIEILKHYDTLKLFKISRTCRSIYMAAVRIIDGRLSLVQRGPGSYVLFRVREPVSYSRITYLLRECHHVDRVQVRLPVERGHMAQLCDVFFRLTPYSDREDEYTVKTVPITNALCPQELRHASEDYSLCLMQRNACIQLLYTLTLPYIRKRDGCIERHHGEIDMDKDWVEKLVISSDSSQTPGSARPSESIPRSDKARLAFPVLEDPFIAWDTLAEVGLKLKASRKWSQDLDRSTFMLRIEEIYVRAITLLRWQEMSARPNGKCLWKEYAREQRGRR